MRKSILVALTLACFLGITDLLFTSTNAQQQISSVKWGMYPNIIPPSSEIDVSLCFHPDGPNPYVTENEGNIHVMTLDQAVGDVTWLDPAVYIQPAVISPIVDTPVAASDYTLTWGTGNHNKILFTYNQAVSKKIPYAESICAKARVSTTPAENTMSVLRFQSPFAPSIGLPSTMTVLAQSGTSGRIRYGAALPATCSPSTGDVFFKTAATIGLYICTAANTWSQTLDASSIVVVSSGGTGRSSLTAHTVLVGNGTSPVALVGPGTAGQCLLSGGAGADPVYGACGSGSTTTASVILTVANDTGTGTTTSSLASVASSGKVLISTAGATSGIMGVVTAGGGTSGNATVTISGAATCTFDNATTAGDYVQLSPTSNGQCHDTGATYPTSGQVLGQAASTNGSPGSSVVYLFAPGIQTSAGSGNIYQGRAHYDVQRDFAASGSATTTTTTGTNSSGATTINMTSTTSFSAGQGILIATGGTSAHNYIGTISSITNSTSLIVSPALISTVTAGAAVKHDDSAAINTAIAQVVTDRGGVLLFKNGTYRTNGPLQSTNGILTIPNTTRIAGSPPEIVFMGESAPPLTGSAVLPTTGVIIDASDFNDSTVVNFGAILSAKTYANTGTVNDTTFNYVQVVIQNMVFRNKANPNLTAINMNNAEGLQMHNVLVDASQALTFTSSGFTVNTQPTHTTSAGIISPALNNIGQQMLDMVTVVGHFYAFVMGDNMRFTGIYAIQNDTGLLFHGNAAMDTGFVGLYLNTDPIVVNNEFGTGSAMNLNLEIQIINTGTWYDVAANHTIYDPLNLAVGVVNGIMPGNTGFTGTANLDVYDTYNHQYQYASALTSAPQFNLLGTGATSPGNQFVMRNDTGEFGVISLSGSADTTAALRSKLNIYAHKDIIIHAGAAGGTGAVHLQGAAGTDLLSADGTLGVNVTGYFSGTKTGSFGTQSIALSAGGSTAIDMTAGNIFECTFGAGNTTLGLVNVVSGNFTLVLIQDGAGNRTITWPGTIKFIGGTAPTLSTGAGKRDIINFYSNGTNMYQTSAIALDVR